MMKIFFLEKFWRDFSCKMESGCNFLATFCHFFITFWLLFGHFLPTFDHFLTTFVQIGLFTFVTTEIPKILVFDTKKLLETYEIPRKLLQIWRDLVESYSRHILKFSSSKSEIQKNIFKSWTKVKNQPKEVFLSH